jgi:hypothetical protein
MLEIDTMNIFCVDKSIWTPKSNIIYGCGPNGKIGNTKTMFFTEFNSVTTKHLAVFFSTVNTGYVVGEEGTLFKTTDGAKLGPYSKRNF